MTPRFAPPAWPTFGYVDDVRVALAHALAAGPAVLATLVRVEGGGPRPVGTQMVFGQGVIAGFLSGGCIESDVAVHAGSCLADGRPRHLVYGRGSPWPDIRLLCGASLTVMVERIPPDDQAAAGLLERARARQPAVWSSDGLTRLCGAPGQVSRLPDAFMRSFDPPWRLIVLGGDPTAMAIAALGVASGYETSLVRPKGPLDPPPIAGVRYSREAPGEALTRIVPDRWTAVAVCHHDLDLDDAALRLTLESAAGYVGLLGGRARLSERFSRLKRAGYTDDDLGRIQAPIGLDLGGKAPFEIALAVLGQITARRHRAGTAHG